MNFQVTSSKTSKGQTESNEASGASPSRPTPTEARPLPDIRVKSDKVGVIAAAIINGGPEPGLPLPLRDQVNYF